MMYVHIFSLVIFLKAANNLFTVILSSYGHCYGLITTFNSAANFIVLRL
jgi:hypothetical protein